MVRRYRGPKDGSGKNSIDPARGMRHLGAELIAPGARHPSTASFDSEPDPESRPDSGSQNREMIGSADHYPQGLTSPRNDDVDAALLVFLLRGVDIDI